VFRGWTWFTPASASEEESLLDVLELIEDHHGQYQQSQPWRELEVVGMDESVVRAALTEDPEFMAVRNNGVRIVRA
jgi:hypothetical protein